MSMQPTDCQTLDGAVPSEIARYYAGKSVFMTGATGFVGKALVEKLLRECPDIKSIYMLVRKKKEKSASERVDELCNCKLFEKIPTEAKSKLVPINGDLSTPELGISEQDQQLLCDNVNIVFHSAATVRFDEPLKVAVNMNVIGTKRVIDLCKKMRRFEVFLHVSTAYANCERREVAELVYPAPVEPGKLIDTVEWMDNEMLDLVTPKVIGARPNTYTYTKAVAETLVLDECGRDALPCTIVRPSIVGASWREPFPGWVDNFNGPASLFPATASGLLRSMLAHRDAIADVVPLEVPVNLMIAAAWFTACKQTDRQKILIYNCTSGQINRLTWGQFEKYGLKTMEKYPLEKIFMIPNPRFTRYRIVKQFRIFFEQLLPAYLMDAAFRIIQKKPIFVKLQKRIKKAVSILEYFTTHDWHFTNDNVFMLMDQMNATDTQRFNFDMRNVNWENYLDSYCKGAKEYLMKESMSNLDVARANRAKLRRNQILLVGSVIVVLLRMITKKSTGLRNFIEFIFTFASKLVQSFFKSLSSY